MKKLIAVLFVLSAMAFGQSKDDSKPLNVYKVDFSVFELQGGKRSNVRNYSLYLRNDGRTHSTKVGNRVPIQTGKEGAFQYLDVGLQFNCAIAGEKDGAPLLDFNFELGSMVAPETGGVEHVPVIRQIRQDGVAQLPLGKPTIISSTDDTNTSRTIQVEATVTLVK